MGLLRGKEGGLPCPDRVRSASIAHGWVTFDAARAAAERIRVPWIAHAHSTEADLQPGSADAPPERIGQGAVGNATRIVAVSEATRRSLIAAYDRAGRRTIDVVPNRLRAPPRPPRWRGSRPIAWSSYIVNRETNTHMIIKIMKHASLNHTANSFSCDGSSKP
jgi:hypothetical protein